MATNLLSHGFELSRLGLLTSAGAHLRDLGLSRAIEARPQANPLAGDDGTRLLLRTAEETSGIPSITSGLLHGLGPTPPSLGLWLTNGQHRLLPLIGDLYLSTGSGKTMILVDLIDQLAQRMGRLNRHEHAPSAVEITHIADDAYALSVLLSDLVQRLLDGCVRFFRQLVAVPPNGSSPCGVLRLAAPRIPRAPGASPVPGPTDFALAS